MNLYTRSMTVINASYRFAKPTYYSGPISLPTQLTFTASDRTRWICYRRSIRFVFFCHATFVKWEVCIVTSLAAYIYSIAHINLYPLLNIPRGKKHILFANPTSFIRKGAILTKANTTILLEQSYKLWRVPFYFDRAPSFSWNQGNMNGFFV